MISPEEVTAQLRIAGRGRATPESAGDVGVVSSNSPPVATVPSMLVVPGLGPGVASVRTPHTTSGPENVLVQAVCVGPVTVPWWKLDPKDDDPVQVAAVWPSSLQ